MAIKIKPASFGSMNKTEISYMNHLNLLLRAGKIKGFEFEPEKLKLADATFYTPDFRVITESDYIEFHEVKGFWRDDARVKIKVAAKMHPYQFIAVSKNKSGGWDYERF